MMVEVYGIAAFFSASPLGYLPRDTVIG